MNHKSLPGRALVKDATQGIAELIVSVYGNVDSDGDIVEQGAVAKQIAGEYGPNPKGLLDHDWSMRSAVAKTLRMWEESDGTHIEAQYNLAKQAGREAFDDLLFYGGDMEFSVGYRVKARRSPTEGEKSLGAKQVITEWQIDEWSHVMLGANSATRLVGAKACGCTCAPVAVAVEGEKTEPPPEPVEPAPPAEPVEPLVEPEPVETKSGPDDAEAWARREADFRGLEKFNANLVEMELLKAELDRWRI